MTRHAKLLVTASLLGALIACDGPNEIAGREKDRAEAVVAGQEAPAHGPNERLGEARDQVIESDRKARDAVADALESRGDQIRQDADVAADRLDDEAQAARNN